MPLSRKTPAALPEVATKLRNVRLPRRIVLYVVVRDESGSMRHWRQRQGDFIPQVSSHLIEVGGPKVGEVVYILYCVISGGHVMGEFVPLNQATDPDFEPDGQTPIGRSLAAVASKIEDFIESRVFPNEITIRNFEVMLISDLQATGESSAETEAGVHAFIEVAKKYRAKMNLVGPSPEAMNDALADRLDLTERGVKYLDRADPKAILDITFDSMIAGTAIGGSNPSVKSL